MDISYLSKSNENINKTYLPDWYEVDFVVPPQGYRHLLKLISELISDLKVNLITKWFFLYEPDSKNNNKKGVIRLRYCTKKPKDVPKTIDEFKSKNNLQIQAVHEELFSKYYESKENFPDEKVLEAFANIMTKVSELNINKLQKPTTITFSNYYLAERLIHCIYNNIYGGLVRNGYRAYYFFLLKLMSYEYKDIAFEENLEATILDNNIDYFEKDEQYKVKILIPRKKKINNQI